MWHSDGSVSIFRNNPDFEIFISDASKTSDNPPIKYTTVDQNIIEQIAQTIKFIKN
ncbi:MAG: hypothetical protein AAB660_00350 [Patescibacteria group bacterium]